MKTILILILSISGIFLARSQQLVYRPVNPMFGGDNTFNYQQLLSSANAQNQFDETSNIRDLLGSTSSTSSFTDSFNRQILSRLSSQIFQDQFGTGGLEAGNYMYGSLYLQITESSQGLLINILDTSNGDQSEIVIPQN